MTLTTNAIKKKQQHRTINLDKTKYSTCFVLGPLFFFFYLILITVINLYTDYI